MCATCCSRRECARQRSQSYRLNVHRVSLFLLVSSISLVSSPPPGYFWYPDTHHSAIQKPTKLAAETCSLRGSVYSALTLVVTCDSDRPNPPTPSACWFWFIPHFPVLPRCPFRWHAFFAQGAIDKAMHGSHQQRACQSGFNCNWTTYPILYYWCVKWFELALAFL